jgi:hypothetical protein
VQVLFVQRFRRLVNLGLAAATLVSLVTLGNVCGSLESARRELKVAKADAFDSVHALSKARAVAYDARTDEAFFVLTGEERDEKAFTARADKLLLGRCDEEAVNMVAAKHYVNLRGFFGEAAGNITFRGEREAVCSVLTAFREYDGEHDSLRSRVRMQDQDVARALLPGSRCSAAFARLDSTVERVTAINQVEFSRAVTAAFGGLEGLPAFSATAAVMVAALSWLGVRSRLKEYSA